MKLISMKRTKADKKAESEKYKIAGPGGMDDYHYGLRISLDNDMLEKLGMSSLPKVGAKLRLEAVAEVVSASMNSSSSGKRRDVSIQIQRMGLASNAPGSAMDALADGLDEADD